jgi:DNA-binding winged helix-turn-helix (wHTH) protein
MASCADKTSCFNEMGGRLGAPLGSEVIGCAPTMSEPTRPAVVRFGAFELDLEAERLLKNGRLVRLQPQPFKLLRLLTNQPGKLVTREEIQAALWTNDTFVDFEQGVNFAVKQVREALGDRGENSIYVETVPKRGYRFLAPVVVPNRDEAPEVRIPAEPFLQRALWENIVELRLSEEQHRKQLRMMTIALVCLAIACVVLFLLKT